MPSIYLPPITGNRQPPKLQDARQITIVGGSGAGKSKFMERLMDLTSQYTFCLSAIKAPYPEREESPREGSIDYIFRNYAAKRPYLKINAVSELEKLSYMLFADEFETLLKLKETREESNVVKTPALTKLDKLSNIWKRIFPGRKIVISEGTLLFSTESGDDLITIDKLSQGEMAVLYYVAGVLYAKPDAVIYIDAPSLFLHPSVLNALWNEIENLRPDCIFVYNSVDVEFVSSRTKNIILWVKSYDASKQTWDYEVFNPGEIHEEIFIDLVGSRKPVLFIEGDIQHSIDAKLYPLVFPDFTVKPLGSCDKVIETTRSFNGITAMHHLESHGIVDRDRRTDKEVEYLRRKAIMVPDVAEVENFFLLEDVVKAMSIYRKKDPAKIISIVKENSFISFEKKLHSQALEHVRYRIKREVEAKIDAKFSCITALETHLKGLINILKPRKQYYEIFNFFQQILFAEDYDELLKVFNHKPLLSESGIAPLLDFKNKDEYIQSVISVLKSGTVEAEMIRSAIRNSLNQNQEAIIKKDIQMADTSSQKSSYIRYQSARKKRRKSVYRTHAH